MVVYADVLVALNLYINYLLLYATALILRRGFSRKRFVLSAFIGALGALVILAPPLGIAVSVLYKIALGAVITFIAFGRQKPSDFAVCALFFLLMNFIFAGVINAMWALFSPLGMIYENGVFYFDIPFTAIIAFTAGAFFLIKLVKFISEKLSNKEKICDVTICSNKSEITIKGLCDTGCEAKDLFTGTPVIICRLEKIRGVTPQTVKDYFVGIPVERIRLIPCITIADETLLPIFKADRILINGKQANALIGVSRAELGENIDCVFNPKIISL